MRITLLSTGSRGDVQPFLGLALALKNSGHYVRLAVPANFQSFVEDYGIEFSLLGTNDNKLMQRTLSKSLVDSGKTLSFMWNRIQDKKQICSLINKAALNACLDAEVIIYRMSPFLDAFSISQKLDIPCFEVGLYPQTRTRSYPNTDFIDGPNLGGTYYLLTHIMVEQVNWLSFRKPINNFREKTLHLHPLKSLRELNIQKRSRKVPVLYAFSPFVVPKPSDWSENTHVTGYWFLDTAQDWHPPEDLIEFIKSGPPPLYIDFGSMINLATKEFMDLILRALASSGQRGILATRQENIIDNKSLKDVYFVGNIPHCWLFPQMAAIIHHGGAGTTAESLRACIPSIIIPHNYDQSFWGKMVYGMGVCPQPILRNQLTVENLTHAITTALSDNEIRKRADMLGNQIHSENGLDRAVQLIHHYLGIPLNTPSSP